MVNHPRLCGRFEDQLAHARFTQPDLERIRDALLGALHEIAETPEEEARDALRAALARRLGEDPMPTLTSARVAGLTPGLRADADPETAEARLAEAFALHSLDLALNDEIAEASEGLASDNAEEVTHRFSIAARERDRAARAATSTDSIGSDGEEALRAELRALHEKRIWERNRRKKPAGGS